MSPSIEQLQDSIDLKRKELVEALDRMKWMVENKIPYYSSLDQWSRVIYEMNAYHNTVSGARLVCQAIDPMTTQFKELLYQE